MTPFVADLLARNRLVGAHYAEPYAGGASLAISLLLTDIVSEVHLNDLDRSVYAFWKSLFNHTNELVERIQATPVTIENWHVQREIQVGKQRASIVDLGFSTFFLNRTNRSGILTGGVVGGKDQAGKWRLDARYNKVNLIERVRRIAPLRSRVHVTKLDAAEFIRRRAKSLQGRGLLFLDPPYYVKGQDLYLNSYDAQDHAEVASIILEEEQTPWLVTYDDVPAIRQLYSRARRHPYSLRYSASKTRIGGEVLFLSPGLRTDLSLLEQA